MPEFEPSKITHNSDRPTKSSTEIFLDDHLWPHSNSAPNKSRLVNKDMASISGHSTSAQPFL